MVDSSFLMDTIVFHFSLEVRYGKTSAMSNDSFFFAIFSKINVPHVDGLSPFFVVQKNLRRDD